MPIYEFNCEKCGEHFEELLSSGSTEAVCPKCGSSSTRKLMSTPVRRKANSSASQDWNTSSSSSACAGCTGGNCGSCGR